LTRQSPQEGPASGSSRLAQAGTPSATDRHDHRRAGCCAPLAHHIVRRRYTVLWLRRNRESGLGRKLSLTSDHPLKLVTLLSRSCDPSVALGQMAGTMQFRHFRQHRRPHGKCGDRRTPRLYARRALTPRGGRWCRWPRTSPIGGGWGPPSVSSAA
jgi:hypothetical protein